MKLQRINHLHDFQSENCSSWNWSPTANCVNASIRSQVRFQMYLKKE